MFAMYEHDDATCPDCDATLLYGTKEEASCWKVYYECGDRCGWERRAGTVQMSEVDHRDEVDEKAQAMGAQWAEAGA